MPCDLRAPAFTTLTQTDPMHMTADQTRHIANLAGTLVKMVALASRRLERFEAMDGAVTVVVDDNAADVVLHDVGASVHVRYDE